MNVSGKELVNEPGNKSQKPSIIKLIIGLTIIIIGGIFLFINENNIVKKRIAFTKKTIHIIEAPIDKILPENEGKLIYLTGPLVISETVKDLDFNIEVNAIHLKRNVEIYQWIEKIEPIKEKNKEGKEIITKKISYIKEWKSGLTNYLSFNDTVGHINPKKVPYSSKWVIANKVMLGAYELSNDFVNKLTNEKPLNLSDNNLSETENLLSINNKIYIGKGNEQSPEIGDIRITYTVIEPEVVSVIGKQKKGQIITYTKKNKFKINLIETGKVSKEHIFRHEKHSISTYDWFSRIIGAIILLLGIIIISTYLRNNYLLKKIYFDGKAITSFLIWLTVFSLIVAFVWITYLLIIGIIFFILAFLIIIILILNNRRSNNKA